MIDEISDRSLSAVAAPDRCAERTAPAQELEPAHTHPAETQDAEAPEAVETPEDPVTPEAPETPEAADYGDARFAAESRCSPATRSPA